MYSLIVATEPLPSDVWDEIGLRRRETFSDQRHVIIYGQRTADDRLVFGGRGAPYHFGSAIRPGYDRDERVFAALRRSLVELFPVLSTARISHSWGGALGIPRDWCASVGLDRSTGLAWAGGYVGDGVGTTNLAGRTLRDLVLGQRHRADPAAVGRPPLPALGARAVAVARGERRAARDAVRRPRGAADPPAECRGPGDEPAHGRSLTCSGWPSSWRSRPDCSCPSARRLRRPRPLPRVSVAAASVAEGGTTRVVLTLDRAAARPVEVRLDTRALTARGTSDYAPVHEVVEIPAGQTRVVVPVATLADGLDEPDESFRVRITDPLHAVLDVDRATVEVRDADPVPGVAPQDGSVAEPVLGHRLGFTEVRLSAPSGRRVVVSLATRPGSAGSGDFVPLHPTVVFAPGRDQPPGERGGAVRRRRSRGPRPCAWSLRGPARPADAAATITIVDADSRTARFGQDGPVTRALVRRPGPRLAEGLLTHLDRVPVDVDLALRQWEGYVAALRDFGWETVEVPPADECPDAVFVEDTVVMYGDLAVVTRPGADERKPETAGTEEVLRGLGYRIEHIEAPATLDGGDVLKHGSDVWVGVGGRTSPDAVDQLGAHLAPLGARVHPVPVSKVLHLKSAVTALPDGAVVGHPPLVDDPARWAEFVPVPEEPGSHVVVLDESTVLMAASAPSSRALFEQRGLAVVPVDIGEFEKLEGCVTCLSVRLR